MKDEKPKRGRPPKDAGDRGEQISIRIPAELVEWLRAQGEPVSKLVAEAVRRMRDGE